jgi:beta-alanine--pyruvate transaminase
MKIALAYWNARGQAQRTRLIGRERGYHGVGFGGMSVGGIVATTARRSASMLAGVDHLPHTYNREQQAFSKGEPEWGAHLADELERIVALHGDNTIAAVIVEPMAGSTAVLPAPKGYLQRLRAICDKYGILLIFDEVITGFGRLGHAFAAERYGVVPDMITFAKGVTSGSVPMGGVLVKQGASTTPSCTGRSTSWSSSTATPIRRIRWPARPASPRSTSIATRTCSSARRSSRSGTTPA